MLLSRIQLLQALGWPPSEQARNGALTWTRTSDDGSGTRVISASVVVTEKAVACRIRSVNTRRPGNLDVHVEAIWRTFAGAPPQMTRWVVEGIPKNPKTVAAPLEALEHFQSAISTMGVKPKFVPTQPSDPALALS